MTTRALLAALAATASLVACGGEESQPASSGNDRQAQNRKAMLDLARCMRENGVNMPDPQFEPGGRVRMMMGARDTDPATMRKAEQACSQYREAIKPPEMSAAQREEFRKAALEHARCMREQGSDFPDPEFDENGGAQVRIGRGSGIDPESAEFRKAQEACRDTLPFGRGGEQ
jgi:hypothetical protein